MGVFSLKQHLLKGSAGESVTFCISIGRKKKTNSEDLQITMLKKSLLKKEKKGDPSYLRAAFITLAYRWILSLQSRKLQ